MKIPNKAPCEKVDGLFIDFVLIFFFPLPARAPVLREPVYGAGLPPAPRQRPARVPHLAVKDETRKGMEKQEPPFRETFYF